ncbi:glycine betaine/L-proline ABC transporter substrate-binding protein ProX [Pelagibacterium sp.]|uniref:glycine betaine/L-proline ABC transporter substrate-binding protein ProX n=1 Tax=Pelagibacterium sp. TaxID=1967288 RepID=UPI003A905631
MFRIKSSLIALSSAAILSASPSLGAMAKDRPGEGVSINMAQATWDTGWFYAEVYRQLLDELGYDVPQITTLDAPLFYQAVAQGDMDLWVDGSFPLHDSYRQAFEQDAEIVGAVVEAGTIEGYLVNIAAIEQFDIRTLADFKRDEVKAAFDRNGDGRADLVACPAGWGCELMIEHHLDAYELREHINPIKAGYPASMADAIAAYEAGENILFYTWTPNWTLSELVPGEDVMWIEVPEVDLPDMSLAPTATLEGVVGCVNDPCTVGFPGGDIVPVANSAFLEANPAVRALLETASVPLADISAQNAAMNNGDDDIATHATEWIEDNRDRVDGWLNAARAAAE